jgi:hypothetical protein
MADQTEVVDGFDRLVPADWLTSERVGEEAILNDRRQGQLHVLNHSAAHVWELLGQGGTVSDLVERFAGLYGMPAAEVRDDVEAVLEDFLGRGLLVRASVLP